MRSLWTLISCLAASWVWAGGGPETTLLVVNADSAISRAVANEYIKLRDLPERQVLWLEGVPAGETISTAAFRERVLQPIFAHLSTTGLDDQIDLIAYSAGFPYAVDFSADLKSAAIDRHRYIGSAGSLTGMTYFARRVSTGDVGYLSRSANRYARQGLKPSVAPRLPTAEERAWAAAAVRAIEEDDAASAIEALERYTRSYRWDATAWLELARRQALAGAHEAAFASLTHAIAVGLGDPNEVYLDERLSPLREHPGWDALTQRMEQAVGRLEAAQGFRSRYHWDRDLLTWSAESRDRYLLSVMLGYTGVRGNSLPEVLGYLRTAAGSDGTHPDGSVYLMENRDIRSRVRQPYFRSTIAALEGRGRRAEIVAQAQPGQNGRVPVGKTDVIGLVAGTRKLDWAASRSRFLPGAIAESFTSYGGHFAGASQTKLTELLRHGAAGSSGAVREPFSFVEKFPLPQLHVFYADGVSLAEAFYLSVASPYQLLVVGDPLARPFAHFASVDLDAPSTGAAWRDLVRLRPRVKPVAGRPVDRVELWIDGQPMGHAAPDQEIALDTRMLDDGFHDLRLVAVEAGPIETRSYLRRVVRVDNRGASVDVDTPPARMRYGERISVQGHAAGVERVELRSHGWRVLGEAEVAQGRWSLDAPTNLLGPGPVSLYLLGHSGNGLGARSASFEVQIVEPPGLPAPVDPERLGEPGLGVRIHHDDGRSEEVSIEQLDGRGPAELRERSVRRLQFDTLIEVRTEGLHELTVQASGPVTLALNGRVLADETDETDTESNRAARVAVPLAAGWHELSLDYRPKGPRAGMPQVTVSGPEPAWTLAGERVRRPLF